MRIKIPPQGEKKSSIGGGVIVRARSFFRLILAVYSPIRAGVLPARASSEIMKLIVIHQILIASAIGLAVLFGVRSILMFSRTGASNDAVLAAASALVAVALGLYLRKVRAKWVAEKRAASPT
jgi:drug/metabolite transporter (DMT)-like permease